MFGWTFLVVALIIAVPLVAYLCSRKIGKFFDYNKRGKKIFAVWMTFTALVVAFWPTWLFLFFRSILAPVGFWQNLLLTGLGLYFLGIVQLVMVILFIAFFLSVIADELFG